MAEHNSVHSNTLREYFIAIAIDFRGNFNEILGIFRKKRHIDRAYEQWGKILSDWEEIVGNFRNRKSPSILESRRSGEAVRQWCWRSLSKMNIHLIESLSGVKTWKSENLKLHYSISPKFPNKPFSSRFLSGGVLEERGVSGCSSGGGLVRRRFTAGDWGAAAGDCVWTRRGTNEWIRILLNGNSKWKLENLLLWVYHSSVYFGAGLRVRKYKSNFRDTLTSGFLLMAELSCAIWASVYEEEMGWLEEEAWEEAATDAVNAPRRFWPPTEDSMFN